MKVSTEHLKMHFLHSVLMLIFVISDGMYLTSKRYVYVVTDKQKIAITLTLYNYLKTKCSPLPRSDRVSSLDLSTLKPQHLVFEML